MRFLKKSHDKDFDLYNGDDLSKPQEAWDEYCGFLGLSLDEYMRIQRRLMEEQLSLWVPSGIGQQILRGEKPATIQDFMQKVPLTT